MLAERKKFLVLRDVLLQEIWARRRGSEALQNLASQVLQTKAMNTSIRISANLKENEGRGISLPAKPTGELTHGCSCC
jgi:hypothetical protein